MRRFILSILFFSFVLSLLFCNSAYSFDGYIQSEILYFPDKEEIYESRNRFLIEERLNLRDWLTLDLEGRVEGLISDRSEENNEILAKIDEACLKFYFPHTEVKIGYSKVFWGKLDKLAPTDIVNPLDISKLFMEEEVKEAKSAIPLFMVSPYWGDESQFDFIFIPFFENGTYDELNKQSSPFNIINFPLPIEEEQPSGNLENSEYGGRFSSTFREIDWSLYYFRGFQDFPLYSLDVSLTEINAEYSKNNMFGCDFELVKGKWGIRGEGAFFTDESFQKKDVIDYTKGNSFISGLGLDRNFGDNYFNSSIIYKKIFIDEDIEEKEQEITLLVDIERKFSYDTKIIKFLSIYNTMSDSMFLKGIFSINLLENLWLDSSVGIFDGADEDTLSKFKDCDFYSIKCKYSF